MKVKAKHGIKTETGWHMTGETFEVKSLDGISEMVDVVEATAEPQTEPAAKAQKTTRKQKEN